MPMQTFTILLYTKNEYENIECTESSCESICRQICKNLGMTPAVMLLFSLRITDTGNFLPGCRKVLPNFKYEFRLRFQVPALSTLKQLDKIAYNYYYHQLKCDLIDGKIPELEYPNHKDKVVGLCVTSMYVEMLEVNMSIDELEKNYKNYIPSKYVKKHSFVIKQKVAKELRNIKNKQHDSYYVKGTYLESLNRMAPSYLVEKYAGIAPYLAEDHLQQGTCPVDIEFSPCHSERPGLSIYYSYKKLWKHISKVEDIYAIIVENDVVKLEMRDNPAGFAIQISDPQKLESFVSCVAGYYRLMVKWTVNLYGNLSSPTLDFLSSIKCHGPIGGEFAYMKLEEKQNIPGSYLIRQCEKVYDTYYIDIITKSIQPETFQITHKHNMWHLHTAEGVRGFNTLLELANSIRTESKRKFRLAPSEYDKSSLLLLCLPPKQLTAKKDLTEHNAIKLRHERPQIFHPVKDFRKYINSQKLTENGIITQMQADWILPDDKKLEVTLKILNSEKHLLEFMRLADKWSCLYSPELIKMYGFTLSMPHTLVIESTKLGPLDVFLRTTKQSISVLCLIDAAYSLARALYYLEENEIIHGKIRCGSLQVVRFEWPNLLIVRLGDPGFQTPFTKDDIPWIPVEYDSRLDQAKLDFKAEIWAYATTLWEIFSRGKQPTAKLFISSKRQLPKPHECPADIYDIMREGWDPVPEKRFSPQMIFARLICSKESFSHSYTSLYPTVRDNVSTISSNGSAMSRSTEHTHLNSHGNISYTSSDFERISNHSEGSTISDISSPYSNDDHIPLHMTSGNSTSSSILQYNPEENFGIDASSVVELDDGGRVIFQGKIGIGHYGTVYKGQYEDMDYMQEVAIKTFRAKHDKNIYKDFDREINIMRNLQHPNIVKIITWIEHPQISIIMEYVKHRSFLMYLSSRSPSLNTQRLLKFAKDISSGMEYLVSKKIIHRDLAARNILVDSDDCVKISDFGLAQVADSNGYYMISNTREIPIKWYAPETIRNNKYSYQSDVWSYGVTLFEMFSRGQEPNIQEGVELKPSEILDRLESGQRLKRPMLCPEDIYNDLMMSCWREVPKERPNFTQLLVKINNFIAEYGEAV